MPRVPHQLKDRIRSARPLHEVIRQEGYDLNPMGGDWRGPCPFQPGDADERRVHTKFVVNDEYFKCWDCQAEGDIFSWFEQTRGLEFHDAVRAAGEFVGVEVDLKRSRAPSSPRREAAFEALGALRELSIQHAESLDGNDSLPFEIAPIDVDELGRLPDEPRLRGRLERLGISAQALHDCGLHDGLSELAGNWILWATSDDRVWAGRPAGKDGPVIGAYGASSSGWVRPSNARAQSNLAGEPLVAADDRTYLALRAAGVQRIYRPIGDIAPVARRLPKSDDPEHSPVLVLAPDADSRRAAFELGLNLLPQSPRLRAVEMNPDEAALLSSDNAEALLEQRVSRAGTLLDWQVVLLAQYDFLDDREGRRKAFAQLRRVVDATSSPVERAFFASEVESLTGFSVDPPDAGSVNPPRSSRVG